MKILKNLLKIGFYAQIPNDTSIKQTLLLEFIRYIYLYLVDCEVINQNLLS